MYLATASLPTSCPSMTSSPAIRRRLHRGFSRVICTMSATISGASGGRPTRRDFQAQKRANPRRCHVRTVSGFTIASASGHRDQTRETTVQKARSMGRSRGRGCARFKTASCWRRTRISMKRPARDPSAATRAPDRAERIASTGDDRVSGFCRASPANRPGGSSSLGHRGPASRRLEYANGCLFSHHRARRSHAASLRKLDTPRGPPM
jgi:hypothetical protein